MKKIIFILAALGILFTSCALFYTPGVYNQFVNSNPDLTFEMIEGSANSSWKGEFGNGISYNGKLCFNGMDELDNFTLFVYDGITLTKIPQQNGYLMGFENPYVAFNLLFFRGQSTNLNQEIFVYDGNTVQPALNMEGIYQREFDFPILFQNELYFRGILSNSYQQIFKYNPTEGIRIVTTNNYSMSFLDPILYHNMLLFGGYNPLTLRTEVLLFDGTNILTNINGDLNYNKEWGQPVLHNDEVYFLGVDTTPQTAVFHINSLNTIYQVIIYGFFDRFDEAISFNNTILFVGQNTNGNKYLYKITGNSGNTLDADLSDYDKDPFYLINYHNKVYFTAKSTEFSAIFGGGAFKSYYYDGFLIRGIDATQTPSMRYGYILPQIFRDKLVAMAINGIFSGKPIVYPYYIDDSGSHTITAAAGLQWLNYPYFESPMVEYNGSVIFAGIFTNSAGVTNHRLYRIY